MQEAGFLPARATRAGGRAATRRSRRCPAPGSGATETATPPGSCPTPTQPGKFLKVS